MHSAGLASLLNLDTYCPYVGANVTTAELQSLNMSRVGDTIRFTLTEIDTFMETNVQNAENGLAKVSEATSTVDEGIRWFQSNEWKPRLAIVVLLVINIFLLIGLVLSRNNIVFNPYRCIEIYVLVPTFSACLLLSALATYGFGAGAIMNADFCAGGAYPGSPEGTIEGMMMQQGVSVHDILHQSFNYYVDVSTKCDCSSSCDFDSL